ncbi:17565_t:CDS:2, partial [Acaulospora colombiana]
PTLLNLYDTHYLALQQALRPITKAFMLALLPGLEEENGEFFDQSFFLQNLWLAMLTTQSARAPALNYLARRLPKLSGDEAIIGGDVGLMIRAFSATLEDDNLLVRRATLDLLLQSLRLDGPVMHKSQKDDRVILMAAATSVVLRRDSALNRRLYTWLLGTEESSDAQIAYLRKNGLDLLCMTLKREMDSPTLAPDAKPLKIFLSLLDKWEIGSQLTDALILYTLAFIMKTLQNIEGDSEDIHLAASSLYEAAEPKVVWKHLFSAIQDEISGKSEIMVYQVSLLKYRDQLWPMPLQPIKLVRFLVTTFKNDEEMQKIHLPICLSGLLEFVAVMISENPSIIQKSASLEFILLLQDMLVHTAPSALLHPLGEPGSQPQRPYELATSFYGITSASNTGDAKVSTNHTALSRATKLLDDLLDKTTTKQKIQFSVEWDTKKWRDRMLECLEQVGTSCHEHFAKFLTQASVKISSFEIVDNVVSVLITLSKAAVIEPKLNLDNRPVLSRIMGVA